MKVKVGDRIYDGKEEIIMVILTPKDKENIANMHPEATRYCEYPEDKIPRKEVGKWMDEL